MRGDDAYKFGKYIPIQQESRWADLAEVKASTTHLLLEDESYETAGIPIISNGEEAWVDGMDNHTLVFGSTGSKKSRLFFMPMIHLFAGAGESMIITDPKGELYEKTSGYVKKKGYNIVVLNFRDLNYGDTWNPLALPYRLYHEGKEDEATERIADFVNAISQNSRENTKDVFWVNAAATIATSILILMLETCSKEECNLKTFCRFCVEFAKGTNDPYMEKVMEDSGVDIPENFQIGRVHV